MFVEEIQYSTFLTAEDAAVVQEEMRKSEVNPGKSPAGLPIDVQDRPFPEMIKRCFFSSERRELRVVWVACDLFGVSLFD